jgi:insertion element IS1 protein InsB
VDRGGHRFLGFVLGSRGERTGRRLWEQIDDPESCFRVMTDHWNAYPRVIPWSVHTASKAQTYTVEGYNSNVRHFLARMRRKTKCYSKSEMMLNYSLRLWMAKWNGTLSILN